MIERDDESVRLLRPLPDLGSSLEHYIAQLFMFELRGHALWGVTLRDVGTGDFDVIAWLPPPFAYVECESGASADIDTSDLGHFVRRRTWHLT